MALNCSLVFFFVGYDELRKGGCGMLEVMFYVLCPVVLFLVYGLLLERFW